MLKNLLKIPITWHINTVGMVSPELNGKQIKYYLIQTPFAEQHTCLNDKVSAYF